MTLPDYRRLDRLHKALYKMGLGYCVTVDEVRLIAPSGIVVATTTNSGDRALDLEVLAEDYSLARAMTGRLSKWGEA